MYWIFGDTISDSFYGDVFASKKGRRKAAERARQQAEKEEKEALRNLPDQDYPQNYFDLYHLFAGDMGERLLGHFTKLD